MKPRENPSRQINEGRNYCQGKYRRRNGAKMSRTGNKPLLIYDAARTAAAPDPGQSPSPVPTAARQPTKGDTAEVKRQTPKQFGQLESSGMLRITAAA